MSERTIYQALKHWNDAKALRSGKARKVVRRVGRRAYGKTTGRLARRIFG